MIRVLHVVTYMGRGGLETMLMNYYRHIDRSKVQFDFLVHRDFEADYDKEILSMGGKIYHVSRLVPWSVRYRRELKKFFQEHTEYKIVHVHQDCLSSVALQCAEECGVPVRIAHSHSSNAVKNIKYLIKRYYMRQIPRYATKLFSCGKQAGDWMFRGSDFKVIPNAIDIEKYQFSLETRRKIQKKLNLNQNIVIGHVGNFTPAKNHSFIVEVFNEIIKKNPKAKLLLVGGGDGMKDVKEQVKALGLQEQVIFTGARTDVNHLMQVMDVFLFPSLYEGIPVTMIEAQAAGLPCVISNHVPDECIVTSGLVKTMKLEDSIEQWGECVLNQADVGRTDHREEIEKAGYEIAEAARKLEDFYIREMRK